ncbi:hypothetical protein D3C84_623060 [compost metagenome]
MRSIGLGLCTGRGFLGADLGHQVVDDVRIVLQCSGDLVDGIQGLWSRTNQGVDFGLSNLLSQERSDVFVSSASQCFGFGSNTVVLNVAQADGFFVDGGDVAFEFGLGSCDGSSDSGSVFSLDGSEVLPAKQKGVISFTGGGCFASQDQGSDLGQSLAFQLQTVECIFVRQCGYQAGNRCLQSSFEYSVGHCH